MSTIKVDNVLNSTGDQDSGFDLSTNDQIIMKTANTTAVTVNASQQVALAGNATIAGTLGVTGNTTLQNLTVSGTATGVGGGIVKQVVNATLASQAVTQSGVYVDTSLAVTITPSSSSNKILLTMNANMYHGNGGAQAYVTIYRGNASSGTNLGNGTKGFGAAHNAAYADKNTVSASFLDSPSTTNAQTYTVAILLDGAGYSYLNVNGEMSTLTAMEIEV